MTPNTFFTHTIQSPERGSVCSNPENVPSTMYGAPRPSANVAKVTKPNHGSAFTPTTVASATIAGPTHGAANTPTTRPDTNKPARLVAPVPPRRVSSHAGGCSS